MSSITLYTGPTPNGRKVSIALEEMGLGYDVRHVDVLDGDQHTPEFLALNSMGELPVLEHGQTVLTQSAMILLYLAEQTG
ncbi:MAG: glutathione S-transferase N-terminal domain-containing protein, partial [Pseudomonadota bacterium]